MREREVKMRANISSPGVCCNQETNGLYSVLCTGVCSFCSKGLPTRAFLCLFGNMVLAFLYSDALKQKKELLTNTALGI